MHILFMLARIAKVLKWVLNDMAGLRRDGSIVSMIKLNKFFASLLNDQNKLNEKTWYKSLYKSFYNFVNVGCIICGLVPSFISFKRIFYLEDTNFFLIFYFVILFFSLLI